MSGLYLEDIEERVSQGCNAPGCTHESHPDHDRLYIHSRCHQNEGLEVSFKPGDDCVNIDCRICHENIVRIQIASLSKSLSEEGD